MTYSKKVLFILIIASTVFSSRLPAQNPSFHHYKIDITSKRVSFFEEVDHIEIIRFEETEDSLLPRIEWYLRTPQGIAIPDKKTHQIHLFDGEGKYLGSINKFGDGPEEYRNISSIWIKNGTIELFSGTSRILQRYTLKGEYIETLQAGYEKKIWGGSMTPYQKGYLVQSLDPSPMSRASHSLLFLDDDLNLISKAVPVTKPLLFGVNLGKRFRHSGKKLLYKKMITDSVYFINEKLNVAPAFKFDFGEDWAWNDPLSTASIKNASQTLTKGTKVYEVLPDVGEKYIILTYYYELRKRGMGFINRDTGKFSRFDMRKKDKENYDIKFLQWEGDRLVASLQTYDFGEFVENLKPDQYTIKGGYNLEDILSSENPVLLKIKFK